MKLHRDAKPARMIAQITRELTAGDYLSGANLNIWKLVSSSSVWRAVFGQDFALDRWEIPPKKPGRRGCMYPPARILTLGRVNWISSGTIRSVDPSSSGVWRELPQRPSIQGSQNELLSGRTQRCRYVFQLSRQTVKPSTLSAATVGPIRSAKGHPGYETPGVTQVMMAS